MTSEFSPAEFGLAWQRFMEHINEATPRPGPTEPPLVEKLMAFLQAEPTSLVLIKENLLERDLPNLQIALDSYLSGPERSSELVGYVLEHDQPGLGLSTILARHSWQVVTEGPAQYRAVELANGERMQCIVRGVYLINDRGAKLVIGVKLNEYFETSLQLEVMCLDRDRGEALLVELRQLMREHNIYRGQIISLGGKGAEEIRFHKLPTVARGDIILPARTLATLERSTLGFDAQSDRLRAIGRHIKRGLLFHGPPGTGKTLSIMYLTSQMHGRTVILLTGRHLGLITPSCRLARLLAPAVVVLEDVDLVAIDRSHQESVGPVLFELLNEMDGLADDVDVLFILSSNRPDLLEPALVARPGRIDQAIEFPLPDEEGRRRLLALYGRGLNLRAEDLDDMVRRTTGASPAFIRELLRKAALHAAEETSGSPEPPVVTAAHLRGALRTIIEEGGELTRRLLGLAPGALEDEQGAIGFASADR
jgi:hypothetical protein